MTQLNLFPSSSETATQVFFINFGNAEERYCLPIITGLRAAGISTEIYPSAEKMKKQMAYANKKGIQYVIMAGENEMASQQLTVKNMVTGEQHLVQATDLLAYIR